MALFGLLGLDESRAFGLTNPPPNSSYQPAQKTIPASGRRFCPIPCHLERRGVAETRRGGASPAFQLLDLEQNHSTSARKRFLGRLPRAPSAGPPSGGRCAPAHDASSRPAGSSSTGPRICCRGPRRAGFRPAIPAAGPGDGASSRTRFGREGLRPVRRAADSRRAGRFSSPISPASAGAPPAISPRFRPAAALRAYRSPARPCLSRCAVARAVPSPRVAGGSTGVVTVAPPPRSPPLTHCPLAPVPTAAPSPSPRRAASSNTSPAGTPRRGGPSRTACAPGDTAHETP